MCAALSTRRPGNSPNSSSDGVSRGWVNSYYLTEYVSREAFCGDPRVQPIINALKQAMTSSDGALLGTLVSPKHGLNLNYWPSSNTVNYTSATARTVFTDPQVVEWGSGGGSGIVDRGTFLQIVQPQMVDVLNSTYQLKVFNWSGLEWTLGIIGKQWLWAAFGLGLILLSTLWFTRFDPSREGLRRARGKPEEAKEGDPTGPRIKAPRVARRIDLPCLSPVVSRLAYVNPFLGVLFAELRLLLNGRRWWWWLGIVGLNIGILVSPLEMTQTYLLPLVWLWPLPVWSEMGNRERKNNTSQMVFSSARPVLRQLPAAWLAGVLATALFGIAGAVFSLSNGDLPGLISWAAAVIFIPTLALMLGVFSSGSRVFEVVYVIWWYIGPLQKSAGMDFTAGAPQVYLLAAAGLLLLSAFWRGRQVRV